MEVFQDYAYYYNIFYQDKDYRREAEQINSLLRQYGKNIGKIMDFGCGTGKHDLELARMDYQCEGIDASPYMIEEAKKNAEKEGAKIKFSVADIKSFEPSGKYDAVLSLFHVMSYQNTNRDVLSAMTSARKSLNENGIFLFDVWYGPGVLSDKPVVRVKEVEDEERTLTRIARPVMDEKENVVSVRYDVLVVDKKTNIAQMFCEIHNMRYFFKPELDLMLQEAGFELIANMDCNTLAETSFSSWTSYFIAKAV